MSIKKIAYSDKIGSRIREWRIKKGFRVYKLADIIGISQGSMSDLENSKTSPSSDTLASFDRNTDINISWLLTGKGDMYKSPGEAAPVPPGVSEPDPGRVSSKGSAAEIAKDYTLANKLIAEMEDAARLGLSDEELTDLLMKILEGELIKQRRKPRPQPEPAVEPLPRPLPDSTILNIMRRIVKEEVPPEGSPERRKCMADITKVLKESDDIKGDISPEMP